MALQEPFQIQTTSRNQEETQNKERMVKKCQQKRIEDSMIGLEILLHCKLNEQPKGRLAWYFLFCVLVDMAERTMMMVVDRKVLLSILLVM